jgi:hypothetical protein
VRSVHIEYWRHYGRCSDVDADRSHQTAAGFDDCYVFANKDDATSEDNNRTTKRGV